MAADQVNHQSRDCALRTIGDRCDRAHQSADRQTVQSPRSAVLAEIATTFPPRYCWRRISRSLARQDRKPFGRRARAAWDHLWNQKGWQVARQDEMSPVPALDAAVTRQLKSSVTASPRRLDRDEQCVRV